MLYVFTIRKAAIGEHPLPFLGRITLHPGQSSTFKAITFEISKPQIMINNIKCSTKIQRQRPHQPPVIYAL